MDDYKIHLGNSHELIKQILGGFNSNRSPIQFKPLFNPPPKFFKAGFLSSCELIVCMWNKGHIWNFGNLK